MACQCTTGIHNHRRKRTGCTGRHLLQQVIAAAIRQGQIGNHAVEGDDIKLLDRLGNRADGDDLQLIAGKQELQVLSQFLIIFHDQQSAHIARVRLFQLFNGTGQPLAGSRFDQIAHRAQLQGHLGALQRGHHMHRHVTGDWIALQPLQHAQARYIRQADIQQDAIGPQLSGQSQPFLGGGGHYTVKPEFLGQGDQSPAKFDVILNRQDQAVWIASRDGTGGRRCAGGGCAVDVVAGTAIGPVA